jgi:hypothetical protein
LSVLESWSKLTVPLCARSLENTLITEAGAQALAALHSESLEVVLDKPIKATFDGWRKLLREIVS